MTEIDINISVMTITINGQPVIVEFVSNNCGVSLYRRADTKVYDGYLYNIYSHLFYSNIYKFHKKLKIYYHELHGYYVKAQGIRCYMNNLVRR